jgi:hypothetical protein
MRGRQKGQTKKISTIKDSIIAPYEIIIEEDQFILVDSNKNKSLSYHGSLENCIKRVSQLSLATAENNYTLTGFIESYNNIVNKLTSNFKNV